MPTAKRMIDCGSAAMGLILLCPVFAAIAAAIKFEDGGDVFFRQIRFGLHGKEFPLVKFRSMSAAPKGTGAEITIKGDKRVTRVGKFLRKTKLDELPQLWNVLCGEMSLVGPRPEVAKYIALYQPWQRELMLSVKPGMTDYAAIELSNEEEILAAYDDPERAYVDVLMPRKFELYKRYVENQSTGLDLLLIMRTLAKLLKRDRSTANG
jgi:lipopolysaccharide/colanic/teichoic acid biosynthesis glycosyltransferase